MGAADVVPGVSGGTIAFITGIYDTLLESIRRVNPSLFSKWRKEGFSAVWTHVNGTFLVSLLSGILTAILTLAKAVSYALTEHPVVIWAFFFGLIVASAIHMIKQVERWAMGEIALAIGGAIFAYGITVASPITLEFSMLTVFIAGSIAICAMILPGISGSFILLLLGMYAPVLDAVKSLNLPILALFALGCLVGILSFSHVLSWLLNNYRSLTIAFLTGLLIGALGKVWPWKEAISFRINSSGEKVPLVEKVLSPSAFEAATGQPSQLMIAVVMMIVGFGIVIGLEKVSEKLAD
ncbi:putative membrane protein [Enterovibrio norvegicus DSM 15893]|nr:putative membrane protein [Enterovibrio norvegicus DSM 15893]